MKKNITIFFTASFFLLLLFAIKVNPTMASDAACTDPRYPRCLSAIFVNEFNCTAFNNEYYHCANAVGNQTGKKCEEDDVGSVYDPCTMHDNTTHCQIYFCDANGYYCSTSVLSSCQNTESTVANCETGIVNGADVCRFIYNNYKPCSVQSTTGICVEGTPYPKVYSCCAGGSTPSPSPIATGSPTAPPTAPPVPSCAATFNATSYALAPGESQPVALTVVPQNGGSVGSVSFISLNASVATVNPASDSISPYQTTVTAGAGANGRSTTINATVTLSTGQTCSASTTINVTSLAWWQVIDSDLLTNGGIGSSVPLNYYFNLVGKGGFPGIPMFGGSTNLVNSNVSVKGWLANSNYRTSKTYNSAYFINLIPNEVSVGNDAKITSSSIEGSALQSGGAFYDGYYWYIYDGTSTGPLTISSAVDLGSRKVILIAKNAVISFMGNVSLTDGSGFFLAISSANINISAAANSIEGIYIADNLFRSGGGSTQLKVRGSVAAYGGVELTRDLGLSANATTPAEIFEYAPDQEMLFPSVFASRITKWKEIAP